ncbi:hypothetical protein BC826DRAFT_1107155 [Russula brevipes]|nr:hypothetical protein BC826DRAFT_1107155 [Russula brevipes]
MSSNVLLTRLESLSNQIRSIVRTPSTRAVALSTADRGIDAAMLLTRALLTHRNTLAPISILPPEVLARIFHLVALAMSSRPKTEIFLRWISVTHVCRHWRQVALDDSSLWARISGRLAKPTWISETLARARNAPLAINLFVAPNAETMSMFTAHFAHTHEFRLRGLVAPHNDDNIREICGLEAPSLKHFELAADIDSPFTFLRAPFFNGMAPNLRTFSLSQIRVPWSSIPRGQLSQLKLTLFGRSTTDRPSFSDSKSVIDLLINCPVLEILVLESCLPQSITPPSHVQAIHLPRLSHLSLRGASSRVANLLGILKLPPSTTLRVHCTSENTATNVDHLLPLVSAHFHDSASLEIKSFEVASGCAPRWITFTAFTYLPTLTTHPSPMWTFLANALNMDRSVDWGDLFQRCVKLSTIEADGHGASRLLKELAPPKPKKAARGGKGRKGKLNDRGVPAPASSSHTATADMPVPIFPKLTSLLLKDQDLCEPAHGRGALDDALSTMLRRRRACMVPLKMLRIEDCFITTKRANALGKLVPEFVQHGNKLDSSSLDESDDFDDPSDVGTNTEDSRGD